MEMTPGRRYTLYLLEYDEEDKISFSVNVMFHEKDGLVARYTSDEYIYLVNEEAKVVDQIYKHTNCLSGVYVVVNIVEGWKF